MLNFVKVGGFFEREIVQMTLSRFRVDGPEEITCGLEDTTVEKTMPG